MLKWTVSSCGDNFHRGSDPRAQTCRGKLQTKRSKLNQEINKELMLRAGAEKLFRATRDKKTKEDVALELSFVNSNLQLLKEQLADLNSSVDIYQKSDNTSFAVPMIPLGLKETKDIDFGDAFKEIIQNHFHEDPTKYEAPVAELGCLRQAIRTPMRDQNGTALLYRYYSQLYYIERRFFPPDKNPGIFFEWYDSLTGVPSNQRTIAFEKASVLFNIAALYTQMGARQDRTCNAGIDASVDGFLRAASMFHYIHNNFSNAPSMDLRPEMLNMFVNLMLAQARECIFEKLSLSHPEKKSVEACLEAGQEAAQVAEAYSQVHQFISAAPVKDYVPYSWISLMLVKREHFKALSHYYIALGLLDYTEDLTPVVQDMLDCIQINNHNKTMIIEIKVPKNADERCLLGKSHLREALLLHEESLRVHRLCRQLRRIDSLQDKLRLVHDRALNKYADIEEEDDFQEVLDPPLIQASTKFQLTLTPPDFSLHRIKDLFHDLGPIAIFSGRHRWTSPRTVSLTKQKQENYGFSVRGDSPVIVATVDTGSLAQFAGMKEGDFIVAIGEVDTKWSKQDDVVLLIKSFDRDIEMKLITPTDHNYLRPLEYAASSPTSTTSSNSSSGVSSASSQVERISPTGSLASSKSGVSQKKLTWNPFRRVALGQSKGKSDAPHQPFTTIPSR